jgi:hypothetical protein
VRRAAALSRFLKDAENPAVNKRMDLEPTIGFRGRTSSACDKAESEDIPELVITMGSPKDF